MTEKLQRLAQKFPTKKLLFLHLRDVSKCRNQMTVFVQSISSFRASGTAR